MVPDGRVLALTTIPYDRDGVPTPVVRVKVSDPERRSRVDISARVDTGFDGGLLIPLDAYIGLGLQQYEMSSRSFVARSAQGIEVNLRSSRGVIDLDSTVWEASIYTTPLLLRPLLGKELLNRWKVILDGPKRELTVG
jgi:clan AA aspartic protease